MQFQSRARDDEPLGSRQPARTHGAQHHGAAERVADRNDLAGGLAFDICDKSGGIVYPLRPRVDVAALPSTVAVTTHVNGVGGHLEPSHAAGESLVSPAVLT